MCYIINFCGLRPSRFQKKLILQMKIILLKTVSSEQTNLSLFLFRQHGKTKHNSKLKKNHINTLSIYIYIYIYIYIKKCLSHLINIQLNESNNNISRNDNNSNCKKITTIIPETMIWYSSLKDSLKSLQKVGLSGIWTHNH